jgi:hypothetical protein
MQHVVVVHLEDLRADVHADCIGLAEIEIHHDLHDR